MLKYKIPQIVTLTLNISSGVAGVESRPFSTSTIEDVSS